MEYLERTHSIWERYNKALRGLDTKFPATVEDYNIYCYHVLKQLYEDQRGYLT